MLMAAEATNDMEETIKAALQWMIFTNRVRPIDAKLRLEQSSGHPLILFCFCRKHAGSVCLSGDTRFSVFRGGRFPLYFAELACAFQLQYLVLLVMLYAPMHVLI